LIALCRNRLYQQAKTATIKVCNLKIKSLVSLVLGVVLITGCASPQATAASISAEIIADGSSTQIEIGAGTTVQQALEQHGVQLSELDQVDPAPYVVLTSGTVITVKRIVELFEIEEKIIPFERQTVRNEGLPEGEIRLLQPGVNGVQEITYRTVLEEGVEISRQPVKSTIIQVPQPEIVMVGAQAAYAPLELAGKIAYLSAGNAWIIDGDSSNRRPLVVSGDLDGRIFSLSPDGNWLLFSRQTQVEEEENTVINEIWIVSTEDTEAEPRSLNVQNVVHFAEWSPLTPSVEIAYSTVEPRVAAPGWQANNDLRILTLAASGRVLKDIEIIPPNAGGQYGWWGTSFSWASDGIHLAFARADSIGIIDLREPTIEFQRAIVPYQTGGDWAWVPGISWGQDNRTLYFVDHGEPLSLENENASPIFNIQAVTQSGEIDLLISEQSGMFSYPAISPPVVLETGEIAYRLAYLQAINPLSSYESSYRVILVDRDGSNPRDIFPPRGEAGISIEELNPISWSPSGDRFVLIYRGDLWAVDLSTGLSQQLTGDGLTVAYDWQP
jgi:hypothetical protein